MKTIRIDLDILAAQYGIEELYDARILTLDEPEHAGDKGDWKLVLEEL